MFVLADEYRFWFPVRVSIPDEHVSGKFTAQTFEVEFVALPLDEARRLEEELAALSPADRRAREHDMLIGVIKDWRGVVGTNKEPIPFAPMTLRSAMQFAWVRAALYDAYAAAMSGEAKRGN